MLIGYRRGQGSIILRVKILNSSVSTGAGLTGLSSTSSGLIISTIADTESTATAYTAAASNIETITTNGTFSAPTAGKCRFKEVDSTNHKGVYEIQIADARFNVSNAKSLLVSVSGATNAAETDVVIPLRDLDPFDSVAGGLSRLDAAVSSRMATYTQPTGFLAATFPTTVSSLTAAGVRTELATELGRIDVATSTRLASSGYTAPPTAAAIADAVWDETIGDHLTAGSTGAALNAAGSAGDPWTTTLPGSYTGSQAGKILADILVDTGTTLQGELDGIQADTEDIQSRLPAALVSGRIDASVGAMAANTVTASALATDAVTEIVGGVWNALTASYTVSGSFGERVLRGKTTQAEVQVNGNGHVASVLHSSEPDSIVAGAFAANSITAAALASDAATEIATATLTTAMTESYRAAGVAPTLAQAAFELIAHMGDSAISGTTKTLKKLDGTTAKTFTLDSSTAPTSITEAT